MKKSTPSYPLLIEKNSNYAFTISRVQKNLSFDTLRNISNRFYKELPEEIRNELHESILHGTCMLTSETELNAYMHDMGPMHNAKLRRAFANLSDSFSKAQNLDVIDYGCGQGLGIIALADYLREEDLIKHIRRIVLIEPSEISLRRAALHASALFPNATLTTIKKGFDDLANDDIMSDNTVMTLHILSNVIDLAKTELTPNGSFDLNRFADLIDANLEGKNQFVGIEPLFNHSITDEKLQLFWNRIKISEDYRLVCNKHEFVPGKNWTCKIICGVKNKENLLTSLLKKYSNVGELSEGMISVSQADYYFGDCCKAIPVLKRGYVNIDNEEVIPCIYSNASNFHNGLAFVEDGYNEDDWLKQDKWGAINKEGKTIIPFIYKTIEWSENDEFIIATTDEYTDKYDQTGNLVNTKSWIIKYTSTDGNIVIPNNLKAFDANIISNTYNNGIGVIKFNKPLTEIGWEAFSGCTRLTSANIPNSVTQIGSDAFFGCTGLTEITIPNSVTQIGMNAFHSCTGLTKIDVSKGNIVFDSRDNCNAIIETKSSTLILGCKSTIIPDSVIVIKESAFYSCTELTEVTIPNSVTEIGKYAFYGCYSLKNIEIPSSVTSIGDGAFAECSGIIQIKVSKGNKVFDSREDCNAIIETNSNALILGCKSTIIPNSITIIARGAFYGCTDLTDITIPNSVSEIGEYAFCSCESLSKITIPASIAKIGKNAFGYWIKPYHLWTVGYVKSVYINNLSAWCQIKFEEISANPMFNGAKLYLNDIELTNLVIPSDISEINDYAFCGCESLQNILILENVTSIGERAFQGCRNAKIIYISKNVEKIDEFPFYACNAELIIDCNIPDAWANGYYCTLNEYDWVEEYGNSPDTFHEYVGPFVDNYFSKITFGPNVHKIGKGAFHKSNYIEEIILPDGITTINDGVFSDCEKLKNIIIPRSVTTICNEAFIRCSSLENIYIHGKINELKYEISYSTDLPCDILEGCESLKNIFIHQDSMQCFEDFSNSWWYKLISFIDNKDES